MKEKSVLNIRVKSCKFYYRGCFVPYPSRFYYSIQTKRCEFLKSNSIFVLDKKKLKAYKTFCWLFIKGKKILKLAGGYKYSKIVSRTKNCIRSVLIG